ncbi:MAG: SDR family NAD(P)-dependent oxidoreductase [Pseudomonadales bacterium]|nr:SDR family NAD(P)-dependent oxidoreductase [Pseudomonadales bacterium]
MKNLSNKVAAITGAASGIGQALALSLAKEGCHIAITDINAVGLKETVKLAESFGVKVTSQTLDVADREAMEAWAKQVDKDHGGVNIVINNAGVALSATVEDMAYDDFEWIMGINFWGVVYGTKAFMPYLKQADEAHIINISSVFGIISVPTQSAYNAAKFGVRGFTESLRQELEISGSNISCTTIHPGGIKTNIAKSARVTDTDIMKIDKDAMAADFEKIAATTAEGAAKAIIKGLKQNKRRVLIGADAKVIDLFQRFLPTSYQKVLSTSVKIGNKFR